MVITIYSSIAISEESSKRLQSALIGTGFVYCDISAHMCALRSESVKSLDDYITMLEEFNAVAA